MADTSLHDIYINRFQKPETQIIYFDSRDLFATSGTNPSGSYDKHKPDWWPDWLPWPFWPTP